MCSFDFLLFEVFTKIFSYHFNFYPSLFLSLVIHIRFASGQRIQSFLVPVCENSSLVVSPVSDLSEDASGPSVGMFTWSRKESTSRSDAGPIPYLSESFEANKETSAGENGEKITSPPLRSIGRGGRLPSGEHQIRPNSVPGAKAVSCFSTSKAVGNGPIVGAKSKPLFLDRDGKDCVGSSTFPQSSKLDLTCRGRGQPPSVIPVGLGRGRRSY